MAKEKKNEEQLTGLDAALVAIKKAFGEGAIFKPTDGAITGIEWLSTGCASLDDALGGGMPRGRIVEVYGPESGGKTTLALEVIAKAQQEGLTCAFIDAEHALDVNYASNLGVRTQELLLAQPDCGEQALEICEALVRSAQVGVVVIDSVAALVPRAELEGEMGDSHVGLQARLMGQAMRKLAAIVSSTNTLVIFINQMRLKVGVLYGSPETTTGGQALKFYASQRLDIRRRDILKEGEDKTGIVTKVKVVKNKVAPPFKEVEFSIIFGEGIDWARDLIEVALRKGVLSRSGAWIKMGDVQIGCGLPASCEALRSSKELVQQIRERCQNPESATSRDSTPQS